MKLTDAQKNNIKRQFHKHRTHKTTDSVFPPEPMQVSFNHGVCRGILIVKNVLGIDWKVLENKEDSE